MVGRLFLAILTFTALLIVTNYTWQAILYHQRNADSPWAAGLAYDMGLV